MNRAVLLVVQPHVLINPWQIPTQQEHLDVLVSSIASLFIFTAYTQTVAFITIKSPNPECGWVEFTSKKHSQKQEHNCAQKL